MIELRKIRPLRCDVCGKTPSKSEPFVTEYACSIDHYRQLTEDERADAIDRWTTFYRENGWYVP